MVTKLFIFLWILLLSGTLAPKYVEYHKSYYGSGALKSEGWLDGNGNKTGYWKFYHPNGNRSQQGNFKNDQKDQYWYFYSKDRLRTQEGHYSNGEKTNWWLFYNAQGRVHHKCQLDKGRKNGYCLKYENEALISAEKYLNGKKIKEWFDFSSFSRENKLSDLR